MKPIILVILLFCVNLYVSGQNKPKVYLEIKDTLIVLKPKQESVKINVKLIVLDNENDTLTFYGFKKFVPSNMFIFDSNSLNRYNTSSTGLIYLIEDENRNIIEARENLHSSYRYVEDELRASNWVSFVDTKSLKISQKVISDYNELHNYELAKIQVSGESQTFELYPLLKKYHTLSKGKYFLYLYYSFNSSVSLKAPTSEEWDSYKPDDGKIFKGTFSSNKLQLIIK